MIIDVSELNWIGVLLAFAAYYFLGALWFAVFFKKPYLKSLGKENAPQEKPAPIYFVGPAICTLIITIASAILTHALKITSLNGALLFAAVVGWGYLVSNTVNIAINPNMPRPLFYGVISGSYHLVGIFICCVILFVMR